MAMEKEEKERKDEVSEDWKEPRETGTEWEVKIKSAVDLSGGQVVAWP